MIAIRKFRPGVHRPRSRPPVLPPVLCGNGIGTRLEALLAADGIHATASCQCPERRRRLNALTPRQAAGEIDQLAEELAIAYRDWPAASGPRPSPSTRAKLRLAPAVVAGAVKGERPSFVAARDYFQRALSAAQWWPQSVTIGVTAFRRPDQLERFLRSVWDWHPGAKVIVADNGDKPLETAADLAPDPSLLTQPAHLQRVVGSPLNQDQRREARAALLRARLAPA